MLLCSGGWPSENLILEYTYLSCSSFWHHVLSCWSEPSFWHLYTHRYAEQSFTQKNGQTWGLIRQDKLC